LETKKVETADTQTEILIANIQYASFGVLYTMILGVLHKFKLNILKIVWIWKSTYYNDYKNSILHIFKVIEVIFQHEFDSDTISKFHPAHTIFKGQDPVAHTTVWIWSAA
jgi:hypothetical protein